MYLHENIYTNIFGVLKWLKLNVKDIFFFGFWGIF